MKSEKIKNIVIGIVATATIVGGLVVLFDPNKPMSYEEYQILIQVYNYEIEKAGGEITLTDVKGNMIEVLNKKLLENPVKGDVEIGGETLTKEDYLLLRSGLFEKAK